jgi:O-antigen ligase
MRNVLHHIDGRLNLPFVLGIYDAAHMLAMINLMLLFYMKDPVKRPVRFLGLLVFFLVNMVLMLKVNSRLSFMTFILLMGLFMFRMVGRAKLMFPLSLFTMSLLTNFALLVYTILTLPFMQAIVSRVNKEDVTTFNNRTTVWDVGWNWLEKDRHGLLLGHGYQGQIHLKGWDHIAVVFNVKDVQNVHMHSTFMQTLINQGVAGYALLLVVVWFTFQYFRKRYREGALEAPLFALVVYMLFILQIDIVCYGNDFGNALLLCVFAMVVMDPKHITRKPRALDGGLLAPVPTATPGGDAA